MASLHRAQTLDGRARVGDGLGYLIRSSLMRWFYAVFLGVSAIACGGCASAGGTWVEVGGQRYAVEIADDDAERAQGLMFRDSMPADRGKIGRAHV